MYEFIWLSIWRVDIQKGVTHISEILHGGTKTFPFWHLDWKKKIVCAIGLELTSRICFAKKTIFEKLWVTPFWMSTLHLNNDNFEKRANYQEPKCRDANVTSRDQCAWSKVFRLLAGSFTNKLWERTENFWNSKDWLTLI